MEENQSRNIFIKSEAKAKNLVSGTLAIKNFPESETINIFLDCQRTINVCNIKQYCYSR